MASNEPERGYLVGLHVRGSRPLLSVEESLAELKLLAETAGIRVVGIATQTLNKINPATFIGSGKAQEIGQEIDTLDASVVIFDDELSPRHQRELEEVFGEDVKVLDRSALILDIFAQHATTHEGRLQVELAQYEYRLPRLTRAWTHLARQAGGGSIGGTSGGVGLRGPGEKQLEADRREIGDRIAKLKDELEKVRAHRNRHRSQRQRTEMPVVALVGYTNAGKSTLMNALSGAGVYVANKLFATLDTTTRRIEGPSGRNFLLSDTVGFIQKLPATLIEAFRATLEGIKEADLILHVVDVSSQYYREHIETVEDTLAQIEVPPVPRVLVLNKVDRLPTVPDAEDYAVPGYDAIVPVSAQDRINLDLLLRVIEELMKSQLSRMELLIPYNKGDLVAWVYESGIVEDEEHTAVGVRLTASLPPRVAGHLTEYQVQSSPHEGES